MRLDAAGPAIPARRGRRNLAAGAEALQQRTALAMLTPKRLAAALRDRPPTTTASTTRSRRSSDSAIPAASFAGRRYLPNSMECATNRVRERGKMEEKSAAFRCQEQEANGGFGTKSSSHGRARVALCVVLGSASTHLLLAMGPIW